MKSSRRRFAALLFFLFSFFAATSARAAETVVENSLEARFQLDLLVPEKALAAYLPAGFTSNVATTGPAKDCNLRVVFIDRISVNGPDGKPLGSGSHRLVYLVAPVKDAAGANAQLVIGGITDDPANVPGPFGNYLLATTHALQRSLSAGATGPVMETQDWVFAAATGEKLEFHVTAERGTANKGNLSDVKFYSAKTPTFYQISRQEQVLDILRNTTTNPPDRVKSSTFTASGGSYAALFAPPLKLLSWDNILWIRRTVLLPE